MTISSTAFDRIRTGISVKEKGLLGDNSANDATALNTLITAIGSTSTDLYFSSGTYKLGTNVTLPSNIKLIFANGAKIHISAGITLTLTDNFIDGGVDEIFEGDGTITGAATSTCFGINWINASLTDNLTKSSKCLENIYAYNGLYGIRDTAVVLKTTIDNESAQVMGFANDSDIANYSNRDNVLEYKSMIGKACDVFSSIVFAASSVTVSDVGADLSEIKAGTIIDAINAADITTGTQTNKYSGFVVSVVGNVITVSGWYKYGNTASGQIPDTNRIVINPCTYIWANNTVIAINSDNYENSARISECNLYNNKYFSDPTSPARVSGIDMQLMKGKGSTAYLARTTAEVNTEFDHGFQAQGKIRIGFESDTALDTAFSSVDSEYYGFHALRAEESGYKATDGKNGFESDNNDIGFYSHDDTIPIKCAGGNFELLANGARKCVYEHTAVIYAAGVALNLAVAHVFLLTVAGTYTIPDATLYQDCIVKFIPLYANTIIQCATANGISKTDNTQVTSVTLGARETLTLAAINTTNIWYVV